MLLALYAARQFSSDIEKLPSMEQVEHFSRYGLGSSDSEDEDVIVKLPVEAATPSSSQIGPDADPDDMQEGASTDLSVENREKSVS